ncbi:MAG TPA: hypothetical protein VF598_04500 [Hymenobacter sp.]|jgi:hypothetical protein
MKKIPIIAASLGLIGAVVLANNWWGKHASKASVMAIVTDDLATEAEQNASGHLRTGLIGAGGDEPLLAHTSGRVKKVFFRGGEYVHQGDVLAKLFNYSFVIAPRNGFLGPNMIVEGQNLTPKTPVTTISHLGHLVVTLDLPPDGQETYRPGDSVRVWVATRPSRVVTGVVAPAGADAASVEIMLGSGAPFRLGEHANVRLLAARLAAVTPAIAEGPLTEQLKTVAP